ncbi:MAG: serine hydrolase domain-containing protein [Thermodesulfobacteriota bacterium]
MNFKLIKYVVVCVVIYVLPILDSAAFAADAAIPERSVTKKTGWWWYHGKSAKQILDLAKAKKARVIDIEVEKTSPLRFSAAMVKNAGVHKKGWWWYYGKTAAQVNALVKQKKARILDLERYRVGGKTRFAVVLVPNTGSKSVGWWWYYGKSANQINALAKAKKARIIDIEVEKTSPYRFSVVLVRNTGKTKSGWWWYYGKTAAQVNALVKQKKARILDLERYRVGGKTRFAVVLVPNAGSSAANWWWYYGINGQQLLGLARRHGSRVIDIEPYSKGGRKLFSTVLLDNGMVMTGKSVPALRSFDRRITRLMKKWNIPGAAVAVVKDGRLVYARGFGLADIGKNKAVRPSDLFRIASISKPLTRSAIFKLRDAGKLKLSDKAFNHLKNLKPGTPADKRINDITIQHLLDHKGGWDTGKLGFDPMFYSNQIAGKMGTPRPTSCKNVIRYMLKYHKLNCKPGDKCKYSNFGYCILGRIIEKVGGKSYQQYVRTSILSPAGIKRIKMGRTLLSKRAKDEVRYYHHPFSSNVTTVFPSGPSKVPTQYGGWYIEAMDSHGGWISSAVDLVRFAKNANPAPYSGNWSFNGSLNGTRSRVVRADGGKLIMSAVFNSRPKGDKGFGDEVSAALSKASKEVTFWPGHDLFGSYP